MTDHRFLTPDRNVQQTRFANGIVVTVNFGAAAYTRRRNGRPDAIPCVQVELSRHAYRQSARGLSAG
jgi:hypothetical protein